MNSKYEYLIPYIPRYHRDELDEAIRQEIEEAASECSDFLGLLKTGKVLSQNLPSQRKSLEFKPLAFDRFSLTIEKRPWWQIDCPVPVYVIVLCLLMVISVNFWLPKIEPVPNTNDADLASDHWNFFVKFEHQTNTQENVIFLEKLSDDVQVLSGNHYIISFDKDKYSVSDILSILEAHSGIITTQLVNQ